MHTAKLESLIAQKEADYEKILKQSQRIRQITLSFLIIMIKNKTTKKKVK